MFVAKTSIHLSFYFVLHFHRSVKYLQNYKVDSANSTRQINFHSKCKKIQKNSKVTLFCIKEMDKSMFI